MPGVGRVDGRSPPVKLPVKLPRPPGAGRVDGCNVLGNLMFGRLDGLKPLNPPGAGRVALPAPIFPVLGKFGF